MHDDPKGRLGLTLDGATMTTRRYLRNETRAGLIKQTKVERIARVSRHPADVGSPEAQVAALSVRIDSLTDHLKRNPRDKQVEAAWRQRHRLSCSSGCRAVATLSTHDSASGLALASTASRLPMAGGCRRRRTAGKAAADANLSHSPRRHNKRGLDLLTTKRRKMLMYLLRTNPTTYETVLAKMPNVPPVVEPRRRPAKARQVMDDSRVLHDVLP